MGNRGGDFVGLVTTISDVAARADVSIRTVSRVVNNSALVNPETRKRVEEAIAHFNFRPSARARGLRTGRSYLLGMVHNGRNAMMLDPVQRGIAEHASARGYELVVHPTPAGDSATIEDVMGFVARSRVDGVIILSPGSSVPGLPESLMAAGVPAVALASIRLEGYAGIVVSQERAASRAVARHLIDLGHCDIALLNGPRVAHAAQERRTGFVEALADEGLAVIAEAEGDYEFEGGLRAMRTLLTVPKLPTAVFVTNDVMAAGALKAAAEAGLSVPRDLSIVGFDDCMLARMLTPALTTVHRPMSKMASTAAACLIDLIEGVPTQSEFFETLSLTIGASTAPAQR